MSVETELPPPASASLSIDRIYRLNVDQYHRMAAAGILREKEPVELLEGLLVTKTTKNDPHVAAVKLADFALTRAIPAGWHVGQDAPVAIGPYDEPEPDLSIIRGGIRDYLDHKPGPGDVELVVEVSDSSYSYDRSRKLARYARAAISHYWIVDLARRVVEAFSEPSGPTVEESYNSSKRYGPEDEIPLILDGQEVARIAVRDLLP